VPVGHECHRNSVVDSRSRFADVDDGAEDRDTALLTLRMRGHPDVPHVIDYEIVEFFADLRNLSRVRRGEVDIIGTVLTILCSLSADLENSFRALANSAQRLASAGLHFVVELVTWWCA
jgi:hypothetical protein